MDVGDVLSWRVVDASNQLQTSLTGTYGVLTFTNNTAWTYTLDNTKTAAIGVRGSETDAFTLAVVDPHGARAVNEITLNIPIEGVWFALTAQQVRAPTGTRATPTLRIVADAAVRVTRVVIAYMARRHAASAPCIEWQVQDARNLSYADASIHLVLDKSLLEYVAGVGAQFLPLQSLVIYC